MLFEICQASKIATFVSNLVPRSFPYFIVSCTDVCNFCAVDAPLLMTVIANVPIVVGVMRRSPPPYLVNEQISRYVRFFDAYYFGMKSLS